MKKEVIQKDRVRKFPRQFSWVDQKMIRENHFQLCSAKSLGLYLFLVLAGDVNGLSYYSDVGICKKLSLNMTDLSKSRQELINADLLAYKQPVYQVLSIPSLSDKLNLRVQSHHKNEGLTSVKEIFKALERSSQ